MQHRQASLRVKVLDADVQFFGQRLFLDDQVFATELLNSRQRDQVRVNQRQNRMAEVVQQER